MDLGIKEGDLACFVQIENGVVTGTGVVGVDEEKGPQVVLASQSPTQEK